MEFFGVNEKLVFTFVMSSGAFLLLLGWLAGVVWHFIDDGEQPIVNPMLDLITLPTNWRRGELDCGHFYKNPIDIKNQTYYMYLNARGHTKDTTDIGMFLVVLTPITIAFTIFIAFAYINYTAITTTVFIVVAIVVLVILLARLTRRTQKVLKKHIEDKEIHNS